jgi:hypothetical protein
MKNFSHILFVAFYLFSCKGQTDNKINKNIYKAICNDSYSTGQKTSKKEINWTLTTEDISNIINLSYELDENEVHDSYPITPCYIEVKNYNLNGKKVDLSINGGSFLYVHEKDKTKILGCEKPECKKYFLLPKEIPDETNQKTLDYNTNSLISNFKIDKNWYGKYTFNNNNFEQGYREYTISIDEKKCFIYAGTMPACEIVCTPKKNGNQIDFFYDSQLTDRSTYSYELVQKSEHGDLIFSIYLKNNKKFIKSPLIKYWKDDLSDFKTNQEIELTNK